MEHDTRLKLVAIATQLFATKGFAGVSVRELTVAANTNVCSISYYFGGKEGLYQSILEEQLSPIRQVLQLIKEKHFFSPVERLKFYAAQIARIHAERPFLTRFIHSEVSNPTNCGGPIIEQHFLQVYKFMSEAIREGIEKGNFRAGLNVTHATISLTGILNFYFISKPLMLKLISLEEHPNAESEYVDQAFQVYLHGIVNPSAEQQ
jgi:TetR/AcrR family transcriptional regulator